MILVYLMTLLIKLGSYIHVYLSSLSSAVINMTANDGSIVLIFNGELYNAGYLGFSDPSWVTYSEIQTLIYNSYLFSRDSDSLNSAILSFQKHTVF